MDDHHFGIRINIGLADRLLESAHLGCVENILDLLERVATLLLIESHDLLDLRGVTQAEPQQEPVELRLGQGKVPSYSIGFWVAITRNGSGTG